MNTSRKLHYIEQYHNYNDKAYNLAMNEFGYDELPNDDYKFNDRVKEIFEELVTEDIEFLISEENYEVANEMKEFYNL